MRNPFEPTQAPDDPAEAPPPDAAIDQTTGAPVTYVDVDGKRKYWTRHTLLQQWNEYVLSLKFSKDEESDLRKKVVAVFSSADKAKGTENVPFADDGWVLKIVKKLNFSLKSKDKLVSDNDAVVAMLQKLAALGPEYAMSAKSLIKWKPELSESEYNKLVEAGDEEVNAILAEVVEFKPGSASVEIIPPKAPK